MGDRTRVSVFCEMYAVDPVWLGQLLKMQDVHVDKAGTVQRGDFNAFVNFALESFHAACLRAEVETGVRKPAGAATKPKHNRRRRKVRAKPITPIKDPKEIQAARASLSLAPAPPAPTPVVSPTVPRGKHDRLAVHRERLRIPEVFARYGLKAIRPEGDPSPTHFMVCGNRVHSIVKTRGKGSQGLPFYMNPKDFDWLYFAHLGAYYLYSAEEITAWKGHCFPTEPKYEIGKRADRLRNPPPRELIVDSVAEHEETACVAQMLTP